MYAGKLIFVNFHKLYFPFLYNHVIGTEPSIGKFVLHTIFIVDKVYTNSKLNKLCLGLDIVYYFWCIYILD